VLFGIYSLRKPLSHDLSRPKTRLPIPCSKGQDWDREEIKIIKEDKEHNSWEEWKILWAMTFVFQEQREEFEEFEARSSTDYFFADLVSIIKM
jgi:hypothetical protein